MSNTGTLITVAQDQEGAGLEIVTPTRPLPVETVLNPTMFNEHAHRHTGTLSTLAVATSAAGADSSIEVASDTVFTVGDHIQISDGETEPTFAEILAKPGANILDLDRRVDYAHAIGTEVEIVVHDLSSAIGSIASPIEYVARPEGANICHIQRIVFSLVHGTAGDMGLFGNLAALTNGVLLRVRQDGQYRTLSNWKLNSDVKDDMFDVVFDTRSSGGGSYGTSGRWTLERFGVEMRLDASTDDAMEIYIQDDITALTSFSLKFQGHYS